MAKFSLPYGKGEMTAELDDARIAGVLTSSMHGYAAECEPAELIERALKSPVGSKPLHELARGKEKVVIIASDHTRPVPSKYIIPPMLREIRRGNPQADITLLIATGCHRCTTADELRDKFGDQVFEREKIVVHDCADRDNLVTIGTLPSGGELTINRLVAEADLLISEGFIEPHFFAGYSGGRKSVLPGIAARESVLANHCSEFIAHEKARTGVLDGNPIHADMLWAAKAAGLAFIVNVVIDQDKEPIYAVAGDAEAAHGKGCEFLSSLCRVKPCFADIVISTNGGYPLDQNVYQAIKGMTAAEASVNPGGVIIMLAKSNDGHGGEGFFRQLADEKDIQKTMDVFLARGRNETCPDQWQTQIFLRVLSRASVVYVSDADPEMIRAMHMIPAGSVEEGVRIAEDILHDPHAKITVIPDGVAVMVAE